MRIGVIGLGFMGSAHLAAYKGVSGCEIGAVCSSDERKLAGDLGGVGGNLDRGGGRFDFGGAGRYQKPADLISDPSVDAVDICTPTHLHNPLAIEALRAGKHVLVEKPMALTVEDCLEMDEAAVSSGRVLMVAQVLRFFPEYLAARQLIVEGELGSVRMASFRRRCAAPAWGKWLKDPQCSGGGVFDLLIHDFDYARHMFGVPRAVRAVGHEDLEAGIDVTEAELLYDQGPTVVISGGWHHPASFPFSMEFTIVCEGGTLDYHSANPGLRLYAADGTGSEVALPEQDGFEAELQAFVDACRSGKPSEACPPEESAQAVAMTLAMRQSRSLGGGEVPTG
ncbi:MAG: Gfo/Idh/MocA family oxidoreductase [Bryobacterales bacterium]|nr:Gfo/Idh/MocA family oxidoreductase [Bryobacterales bacterium]